MIINFAFFAFAAYFYHHRPPPQPFVTQQSFKKLKYLTEHFFTSTTMAFRLPSTERSETREVFPGNKILIFIFFFLLFLCLVPTPRSLVCAALDGWKVTSSLPDDLRQQWKNFRQIFNFISRADGDGVWDGAHIRRRSHEKTEKRKKIHFTRSFPHFLPGATFTHKTLI